MWQHVLGTCIKHGQALHGNEKRDANMRHIGMTNEKHRNRREAKHSMEMNEAVHQAQGKHESGSKAVSRLS